MTDQHLSEEDLQQYGWSTNLPQAVRDHLQACAVCSARLEVYQLMFLELKEADKPQFDFDVADSVMTQLPAPVTTVPEKFSVYLAVLLTSIFIAAMVWTYQDYLTELFSGSHMIIQISVAAIVSTVLVLQALDVIKRYQKKMQALDFI